MVKKPITQRNRQKMCKQTKKVKKLQLASCQSPDTDIESAHCLKTAVDTPQWWL